MDRYKSLAGFSIIDFAAAKISTPRPEIPEIPGGVLDFQDFGYDSKEADGIAVGFFMFYWIIDRKSSSLRMGIPSSLALRSLEPAFSPTTT